MRKWLKLPKKNISKYFCVSFKYLQYNSGTCVCMFALLHQCTWCTEQYSYMWTTDLRLWAFPHLCLWEEAPFFHLLGSSGPEHFLIKPGLQLALAPHWQGLPMSSLNHLPTDLINCFPAFIYPRQEVGGKGHFPSVPPATWGWRKQIHS